MNPEQWLNDFRAVHERARSGKLAEGEKQTYLSAREQLARSLLSAQGLTMDPGKSARQSFRVAQGLQVDLELASGKARAMTLDVSVGGFSVMLPRPPDAKETPGFSLRLPGGKDPLVGRLRVASVTQRPGHVRASFSFLEVGEKDLERLEMTLFDLVLERLK